MASDTKEKSTNAAVCSMTSAMIALSIRTSYVALLLASAMVFAAVIIHEGSLRCWCPSDASATQLVKSIAKVSSNNSTTMTLNDEARIEPPEDTEDVLERAAQLLQRGSPAPPYPSSFPDDICEAAASDFRSASGLFCIVTGCEHSGTTLMSEIIMNVPNLYSGFEGGLLMGMAPSFFTGDNPGVYPFNEFMVSPVEEHHWGLTEPQLDWMRRSKCHAEMYAQLKLMSPLFKSPNNENWIVDKTPRYTYVLSAIMARAPGVPVIVTRKPAEDQYKSFQKHNPNNDPDEKLREHLEKAQKSLEKAKETYPDRIYEVDMTEFVKEPDKTMTGVFQFLGLEWHPEYTDMEIFNVKGEAVGRPPVRPFYRKEFFKNRSNESEPAA